MERRSTGILILVIVALIAFLFGAGILYFRQDGNSASIHVDTGKVEEGAEKVVDKTQEIGGQIADETKDALERVEVDVRTKPAGDRS